MAKNIKEAKFITEIGDVTANMYRLGWDERNGGNISYLLKEEDLFSYLDLNNVIRKIPLNFTAPENVRGKYFLVTGTGKYFKNIQKDPENNLGIFRVSNDGNDALLLWGYQDGGRMTSEFPAHLLSHSARLNVDPENRVIMHTHPTFTICMGSMLPVDEVIFTRKLWKSNTEAVVVFPEGIGVLPCMVCGTNEIGEATANKMNEYRIVSWTNHGIYGAGRTIDETFGLIETVEKTAQIYVLTKDYVLNEIPDSVILGLAELWNLKIKKGVIEVK